MKKFVSSISNFSKIPGSPFAYWCTNFNIFSFNKIGEKYLSGGRNKTHNNELYLRCWWEIIPGEKWQAYANGGDFRRWYGNNYDLVNWSDEAKKQYDSHGGLYNKKFWGKSGVCWNLITSYKNSFRIKENNYHYSSASPTIISGDADLDCCTLGFLNTEVATFLLKMFNPTLNTTVSDVLNLPFETANKNEDIKQIVLRNLSLTKKDWDAFETSSNFKKHPLI